VSPSGSSAEPFTTLEATPEPLDRPLESRPTWPRIGSSLPREAVHRLCLEATPEQLRRVREDTRRYVRCRLSCLRASAVVASIRSRAALSLGKVQADPMLRGQPQSRAQCVRITPVVALECVSDSLSGECGAQSVDRGKPWYSHAECETHARWWFGGEMCLFREVAAQPRCWRQLQDSLIGAGITPVVVPGCVTLPLRGQRSGSGALESPPGLPRSARIKDLRLSWPGCVLRVLRNLQSGSKLWTHSPVLPRPLRQSAVRNPRLTPPLRERTEPGVACTPCSGRLREV